MAFSKISKLKARDTVIAQLITAIREDRYRPGDRLPTEAELTEAMGVGRSTIREALQGLEVLGVIEREKNGAFVAKEYALNVVSQFLYTGLLTDQLDLAQIYQARQALESELGALAAAHMTPADIADLRKICEAMEQTGFHDGALYLELNRSFHQRICEVAGNAVLMRMWQLTNDLLHRLLGGEVALTRELKELSDARHAELLEAFERRDTSGASSVIIKSLHMSEALLPAVLPAHD